MLTRLDPEQANEAWDSLKPLLSESLVPTVLPDQEAMWRVLEAILKEKLVIWVSDSLVVSTAIIEEFVTGQKNLLIYSFNIVNQTDMKPIAEGLQQVPRYARGYDCNNVVFYADNPKILKLARRLGFTTPYLLGIKEV